MNCKNTICLWYGVTALEAARFYAATIPASAVGAVYRAPGVPLKRDHSSHLNRQMAMTRHAAAAPISTNAGVTAAPNGRPRQVAPSRPSTAQRVGVYSEALCNQFGNTKAGTQAPPTMTMSNITIVAIPRVAGAL